MAEAGWPELGSRGPAPRGLRGHLGKARGTLEGLHFPGPGLKREGTLELRVSGAIRAGPVLGSPREVEP